MHYAQASVYSMVGMDHVLEPFIIQEEENAFAYTTVNTVAPQQPDIFIRGY